MCLAYYAPVATPRGQIVGRAAENPQLANSQMADLLQHFGKKLATDLCSGLAFDAKMVIRH